MFNPVKFCFRHDRVLTATGHYLQLEAGSFLKLTRVLVHVQHEPCDKCAPEEKVEAQGRLFDET